MSELLCAVLRPDDDAAVTVAGTLAERLGLALVLVEVRPVPPALPPVPGAAAAVPTAVPDSVLTGEAGTTQASPGIDLDDLARRAGVRPARTERVDAVTAHALAELSGGPGVELLVAGDHGGGPLRAALTGEAPRAAMRDVHAPLVLVPHGDGPAALGDLDRIACAVDDDDVAATVTAFAADLAGRLGAALSLVHAGDDPGRAEHLHRRCASVLPEGLEAGFALVPGDTEDLHDWAVEHGAGLLVLGRPGHGRLASALRGSVAHRAAEHAAVPVVVVPDAVQAGRS